MHASSSHPVDAPVVIVGGGPVGLATALGLSHHGVRSILIERDVSPVRESRAFGIWARTLEVLRDWGVFDNLVAAGDFFRKLSPVNAATERPIIDFDFATLDHASATAGVLIIPQNVTERVLRAAVESRSECKLVVAECTGIELRADSVGVRIAQAGGGEAIVNASFVAACDGSHSFIRQALGLRLEGETYPNRMVLSDERIDEQGLGHLRFAPKYAGFLAAVRFQKDLWRVMATVPDSMSDEEAAAPESRGARLRALFGDRAHETVWSSQFRVHRRAIRTFRQGRVLFAGDAAHLNSPAGGQGMNSGIQDAENLAWKLAHAVRGGDVDVLLDSYHEERHEACVEHVQKNSDRNTQVEFNMPAWLKPALFGLVDAAIRIGPIGEKLARGFSMLDVNYTHSPLLVKNHDLVGVRIDDLAVVGGGRVSDRLKGRPGIISLGKVPDVASIATLPVAALSTEPRWHVRSPAFVVVRPDRYVGAVVEAPSVAAAQDAAAVALGWTHRRVSP